MVIVNVDLYRVGEKVIPLVHILHCTRGITFFGPPGIAHCHKVSNALCTVVTREQASLEPRLKDTVLLCTKVIRQRVPDCRTLHSECSAANSGQPVSWHHHQLMCG